MVRRTHTLILLAACATTGPVRLSPEEVWPDTAKTVDSIQCAITKVHGRSMPFRVLVQRDYAPGGATWPGNPPLVIVDADARTALASRLRHEVFQHVVPWTLGHGWNAGHAEQWTRHAKLLDREAGLCRIAARTEEP